MEWKPWEWEEDDLDDLEVEEELFTLDWRGPRVFILTLDCLRPTVFILTLDFRGPRVFILPLDAWNDLEEGIFDRFGARLMVS